MKSKKTNMNPAEALGKMQRAKMGKSVGSYLEGGRIMYNDGDPKKKGKLKEQNLDEVDANTSNIFQKGLFRKARAGNYAKNNPGTASSVRNYGKRRVVTTYNDDGFKGKAIRKNV